MDDNGDSMNNTSAPQSDGQQMNNDMHNSMQNDVAPAAAEPNAAQQTPGDDISEHKLYAILGYILPFLFFLPLLQESSKHNAFARFHANQQLILLIGWAALYVVGNMLVMILYMMGVFLLPLLNLAFLVLAILGIIHAAQGQMKELPVIGKFRLLK